MSMKGKQVCKQNDCGYLNNVVSDKAINGILAGWVSMFETETLRKAGAVDQKVIESLGKMESVVMDVKKISSYENMKIGSVFEKVAPLFKLDQFRYKHYLF